MKRITTSLFYILLIFCFSISGKAQTNPSDSLALVALYNATGGNNWTNTWNLNQPVNSWQGVVLNDDGRVSELNLSYNGLSGSMPPEIGSLVEITSMYLIGNNISGDFPSEMSNLTNLKYLNLNYNNIGSINASIGHLTNLEFLHLTHNNIGGIDSAVGNLTNLKHLYLNYNNIGGLPSEIGHLTNLERLYLSHNNIGGINDSIGNLANLEVLHLDHNDIGGINPTVGHLTNLKYLDLNNNAIAGINPAVGNLTNLEHLLLDHNAIGGINPAVGNLTNLRYLHLNYNNITNINPVVYNLINLESLSIENNQLTGSIPPEIGNLTNLIYLTLSDNQLTGTIPPELENLVNLNSLRLYNNQLTGSIPPEMSNMPMLRNLYLYNNQLSGCYDADLSNLCSQTYPQNIYISDGNNFDTRWEYFCELSAGTCGSESTCRQNDSLILVEIYSRTNGNNWTNTWNLNQPVDTWYGITLNTNGCVTCIDMDGNDNCIDDFSGNGNNLDGYIPSSIAYLNSLTFLNLSNNHLSGYIPPELGNLNNLTFLGLSNNELGGTIPRELGEMNNLNSLTLFNNQLNGCYTDNLANLCAQLEPIYSTNTYISDGNNLEATWEDFCNNGTGCYLYSPCRERDSLTLVEMFNYTDFNGDQDIHQPMDTWFGVTLNENGCVKALNFGEYNGGGDERYFPPQVVELVNLESLYFIDNYLIGSIPPEIENLTNLKRLYLRGNLLNGNIPSEIENLSYLTHLDLGKNQLSGNIPSEIGSLSNLTFLNLGYNEFTDSIPAEIWNLTNLEFLHIYLNQLTGSVPNLNDFPNLSALQIQENKFSHEDIFAHYTINNTINTFRYSPQYHGEVQSHIAALDTVLTLELSTPLVGNNNQNVSYQWKKNGTELVGSTDSTFIITNMQISDIGVYTLHMTDSTRIADLEVISEPIYVIVPGYDLYGQPVEYNQLIIEYDDLEDKENYETNHLFLNGAFEADHCSCNRLLYLYQFPNDTIALQTLLDIDTKKQSTTRRGRLDGGFNNILGIGPIPGTQGWTWTNNYPHNYPDSVSIFLLDSGTDVQNWDATSYLNDDAPLDSCYNILPHSGYDYTDTLTSIQGGFVDSIGHGTFGMRSIAEGSDMYMNMNVVPLKVFDQDGQGTLFNFICALYHAIDHDADIINVSAGYTGQASGILEDAIALAHAKGQFIVTATGNDGVCIDSFPQYPAYYAKPFYKTAYDGEDSLVHYTNVISVAAIDATDTLWRYSNYGGGAATIAAYGENMGGYAHTGEEVSYSGTSLSTYYVTRQLAAEIARNKTRSLQDIWAQFEANYLRDCPSTNGLTSTGKCLDISLREVYGDLHVFLEGAFDILGDTMHTKLNTLRHILPGQRDSTFDHTMATQPYDIAPFDYYGTERVPPTFEDYPTEVVDWILVSARTEIDASSTVSRTSAWLLKDGRVQLLKPLFDELTTAPDSVYIVIEHRNHMGVMSPQKLSVERNLVTWDFTLQNSYTISGTGQVLLNNLYWGMLTGDTNNDIDGYDINGDDKGFWGDDNGQFGFYLPTDFNMDGDINGQDKIFWKNNNGKFSGISRY